MHYQKALQLKPDYAEAEYNLGTALVQKNNLNEAIVHFQKALRLKPDYASAAYNIGIALFHQDKVDEAAAFFQKSHPNQSPLCRGALQSRQRPDSTGKNRRWNRSVPKSVADRARPVGRETTWAMFFFKAAEWMKRSSEFRQVLQATTRQRERPFQSRQCASSKRKCRRQRWNNFEKALQARTGFCRSTLRSGNRAAPKRAGERGPGGISASRPTQAGLFRGAQRSRVGTRDRSPALRPRWKQSRRIGPTRRPTHGQQGPGYS